MEEEEAEEEVVVMVEMVEEARRDEPNSEARREGPVGRGESAGSS